ncbi:uncharacterized protein LOC122629543 [Vespula pensylvanica]|nr:uncharacterized protein LOC122629543 [Vespula pensylvanica]
MHWSYIRFSIVSMLTMLAGAQTVHVIYKPLTDVDQLVEEELEKWKASH